jgi:hypothetical protein
VGDVLGQIQVDSIERLLSRPASDMHRAIEDAEAQIDSELNRASDPRIREQLGEANEDKVELDRATAAVLAEKEHGVALDVFLRRAVLAAGGSVDTMAFCHPGHFTPVMKARRSMYCTKSIHY